MTMLRRKIDEYLAKWKADLDRKPPIAFHRVSGLTRL